MNKKYIGLLIVLGSMNILHSSSDQLDVARLEDILFSTNLIGETKLMEAVRSDNKEFVRDLIAAGADPNTVNPSEETALFLAAVIPGRTKILKILIDAGADKNRANSYQYTPLMWAAIHHNLEQVETLVIEGADVTTVSKDGNTVFKIANNSFNLANSEDVRVLKMIKDRIAKSKAVDIPCSCCLIA